MSAYHRGPYEYRTRKTPAIILPRHLRRLERYPVGNGALPLLSCPSQGLRNSPRADRHRFLRARLTLQAVWVVPPGACQNAPLAA